MFKIFEAVTNLVTNSVEPICTTASMTNKYVKSWSAHADRSLQESLEDTAVHRIQGQQRIKTKLAEAELNYQADLAQVKEIASTHGVNLEALNAQIEAQYTEVMNILSGKE